MIVLAATALTGDYALTASAELALAPTQRLLAGRVRLAQGRRSPESGLRSSGEHEIGHVLKGRLRIETAERVYEVAAGDSLIMCPAELHSTTAMEDSEIFFVLLDPHLATDTLSAGSQAAMPN
jgi:quercetin dioxygenase-like cupin family protein